MDSMGIVGMSSTFLKMLPHLPPHLTKQNLQCQPNRPNIGEIVLYFGSGSISHESANSNVLSIKSRTI